MGYGPWKNADYNYYFVNFIIISPAPKNIQRENSLYITTIIIFIGIQPLGRSGQRPELSQATGMALVRCILGKFLGVACHCFPPIYINIFSNLFIHYVACLMTDP